MNLVEQADGRGSKRRSSLHSFLKKHKRKIERRRAKENPECSPGYGKYKGYET
jgi:hypothetical protein